MVLSGRSKIGGVVEVEEVIFGGKTPGKRDGVHKGKA